MSDAQPLSLGGVVTGYTWRPRHTARSGCGWTGCWGSTAFNRTARRGAEAKAERIIRKELKRWRLTERALKMRAKSEPAKLALAARVRRETTQTLGSIAHRVHMGRRKAREKAC